MHRIHEGLESAQEEMFWDLKKLSSIFNYFCLFAQFLIKSANTGSHFLPITLAAAADTDVTLFFLLHLGLSGTQQQGNDAGFTTKHHCLPGNSWGVMQLNLPEFPLVSVPFPGTATRFNKPTGGPGGQ